jgi:hypothetical protein
MDAYKSVIQGLTEAVDYQQGKISARKVRLTIKPEERWDVFKTYKI